MSVSHDTHHANKRPQIRLKGDWLEDIEFSHKTLVVASYDNDILTLQAQARMEVYNLFNVFVSQEDIKTAKHLKTFS